MNTPNYLTNYSANYSGNYSSKSKNTEGTIAPSCLVCQEKPCLLTGKPCQAIEKLLPKPRSGGHRKEFPSDKIDDIYQHQQAKIRGYRKSPHLYDNNYELEQ